MAEEPPGKADRPSFSELTIELIEQAAALAGERAAAPIRAAGSAAARGLTYAACAAVVFALGAVFLGVSVGLLIHTAPEPTRWLICLLVALGFFLLAAAIGLTGFRRKPKTGAREKSESEE
jgi:protein-S-isoprenylcysteine O-methyltransferase Ste14